MFKIIFLIFALLNIIYAEANISTEKKLLNEYAKLLNSLQPVEKLNSKLPVVFRQKLSEQIIKFASSLNNKNKIILQFNNKEMNILPYITYYFSLKTYSPINYQESLEEVKNQTIKKYKEQYQDYYEQYKSDVNSIVLKKQKEFIKDYKVSQIYFYPYKNLLLFVKLYNNTYTIYYLKKNENKVNLIKILHQKFNKFNFVFK